MAGRHFYFRQAKLSAFAAGARSADSQAPSSKQKRHFYPICFAPKQ